MNSSRQELLKELGHQIRKARTTLGMTQAELARRVGTSRPSVIGYEKGKTPPTVDLLTEMARVLAIDFTVDGYVIARSQNPPPKAVPEDQLCLDFDTDHVFSGVTVRIRPSRDAITIDALIPRRNTAT